MNPCAEALAEVHLQPTNEWTLKHNKDRSKEIPCFNSPSQTHKLLLLIRHQFGDFVFASSHFFLVVGEVANDKLLLTGMQFELVDDFLEERHVEESKVLVLGDELGRAWNDHVGELLTAVGPIVEQRFWNDDQQRCQVFRVEDEMFFLHQVGQVSCKQTSTETTNREDLRRKNIKSSLRLFLLQVLQVSFQAVVG